MPLLLLGCLGGLSLRAHSLPCSHSTATCLPKFWLAQPRALRPCAPCAGARSHVDDGRTQQQEHQLIDHGRRILSHEVLVPSIQASAASNARLNQLSGQGQQLAARVRDLESALELCGLPGPWVDDSITELRNRPVDMLENQTWVGARVSVPSELASCARHPV